MCMWYHVGWSWTNTERVRVNSCNLKIDAIAWIPPMGLSSVETRILIAADRPGSLVDHMTALVSLAVCGSCTLHLTPSLIPSISSVGAFEDRTRPRGEVRGQTKPQLTGVLCRNRIFSLIGFPSPIRSSCSSHLSNKLLTSKPPISSVSLPTRLVVLDTER